MAEPSIWLPLNGTLENLGLNSISLTNNGATVSNSGKIGSCYSFDGTDDRMYTTGLSLSNQEMSAACWINLISYKTYGFIFSLGDGKAVNAQMSMYVHHTNHNVYVNCNGSELNSGCSVALNEWHHICFVYKGTQSKLYIDGSLRYTGTNAGNYKTSGNLTIAARADSALGGGTAFAYPGNLLINDFRIYDIALSDKEIHDISRALVLHYPLDNNGGGGENLLKNSSFSNDYIGWQYNNPASGDGIVTEDGYKCMRTTGALTTTRYYRQNVTSQLNKFSIDQVYTISAYVKVVDIVKGTTNFMCEFYFGGSYNNNGTSTWLGATTVSGKYNFFSDSNQGWKKQVWVVRFAQVPTEMWLNLYFRDGTGTMYVRDLKMEPGNIATEWSPCSLDYNNSNVIYDCSGFHNDGSKISEPITYSGSARYDASTYFDGIDDGILIQNLDLNPIFNNSFTLSFWINSSGENGGRSVYFGAYSGTSPSVEKNSGNNLRLWWNGSPDMTLTLGVTDNSWHHVVLVGDGLNKTTTYLDGILKQTSTTARSSLNFATTWRIGRDTRSNDGTPYHGLMSDFRLYATALTDDDVKELYNVGASVDNQYNIHTYDYIEDEYSDNPSIYKSGIVKARSFVENFSEHTLKDLYDTVYYIEPDGSKWIRIFHHNNPASKLFSSTNNFIDRVYIDADRWFDISICNYVSRWELMVKQKTTSSAAETKYRWIQFVNPMIGTFNETKAADVIKITTSGYTTYSNAGGIIQGSSERTYMTINNGTSTSWYGALGCWTAYNGGIPGYPNNVVTSGYMDLYLRIDDPGIYKEFIAGNELIEI